MKPRKTSTSIWASGSFLAAAIWLSVTSVQADALDNWTTNQLSTNWFGLQHVVYGNGRYVAGGTWSDYGVLLSSEDGSNWTIRANGTNVMFQGLAGITSLVFDGVRFLATAGPFGYSMAVSTNGIQWSWAFTPNPSPNGNLNAVSYGKGTYVLAYSAGSGGPGVNSNNFYYLDNGTTWTPAFKFPEEARDVWDVAFGANRFVAVANGGFAYTSSDGVVWIRGNIAGGNSIAFAAGRFFVPLSAGTNLISTDGANWAAVGTALTNALGKIVLGEGVFFARAGNYLATSTDGTNWIQRTSSTLPGDGGIASDGMRFVNVGRRIVSFPLSFDTFVFASDLLVNIGMTSSPPPLIVLSGVVGRSYRIEYLPYLPSSATNTWQALTNLILPSSPYSLTDPEAPNPMQRFYRAVLLP